MARNRSRNKRLNVKGAGAVFPAPLAGILLLVSALALSYLWVCGRCDDLGKQIKEMEKRRAELDRQLVNEEFRYANMTSPQQLEKLIQLHRLPMIWPPESAIVRVRRDLRADAARAVRAQELARQEAPSRRERALQ